MGTNLKTTTKVGSLISAVALAALLSSCAAKATPEQMQQASQAKMLSGAEITSTISGNTLSGISNKGPAWTEFYAADGSIHGLWGHKDKYAGKWNVTGDKFCLDYEGDDDSDGCSNVSLKGDQFYWLKDDGMASNAARPATVASGNPENL